MSDFYARLQEARAAAAPTEMPGVEASREIIYQLLHGDLAGFDKTHYFIYQNVKVYEQGFRAAAETKDALLEEEVLYGKNK